MKTFTFSRFASEVREKHNDRKNAKAFMKALEEAGSPGARDDLISAWQRNAH